MTLNRFEKPWGVIATARNINMVAKLVELPTSRRHERRTVA
jgi:hypothetical protein